MEQLLHLLVKDGFVGYDEGTGGYALDALAGVARADLQRALGYMNMIKVVALRQLFYLTASVRAGVPVGLVLIKHFRGPAPGDDRRHVPAGHQGPQGSGPLGR